ncbi:MAG: hypothetical protein AAFV53_37600, partial [Myxococcota bacterium]
MPIPPSLARNIASMFLPEEELQRLDELYFRDAGHGYDPFGMHPSFIALTQTITGPLYDRYFRVISRGHEHIPSNGRFPEWLAATMAWPVSGMCSWPRLMTRKYRSYSGPVIVWVRAINDGCIPNGS